MGEELLLEIFGDPALDDNVVAITLKGGKGRMLA